MTLKEELETLGKQLDDGNPKDTPRLAALYIQKKKLLKLAIIAIHIMNCEVKS